MTKSIVKINHFCVLLIVTGYSLSYAAGSLKRLKPKHTTCEFADSFSGIMTIDNVVLTAVVVID